MTKVEVLVPACPPAGAVASPIWATSKFADKLTTKVLVPACLPAGAVASPVWATSDRSSGCVRDGCFSSGLCPKETRPSRRRFSVGVVFRMLRFFVLVGAGGVAHAVPPCTYSRLAQATYTPTPRALPNQTALVPTGPEANGVRSQLEEHPLRHGGRGEAPCRIFFRALGPATQTPLERGDAEGLGNKNAFLFSDLLFVVYGRKYRTLSSSYEPERGKRKVWPISKQAFSNGATSKCGRMKEGQDGGAINLTPPKGGMPADFSVTCPKDRAPTKILMGHFCCRKVHCFSSTFHRPFVDLLSTFRRPSISPKGRSTANFWTDVSGPPARQRNTFIFAFAPFCKIFAAKWHFCKMISAKSK